MHGAGNSFVIAENLHGEFERTDFSRLARDLCKSGEDIKTDGLMVLTSADGEADFRMLFYNADGSVGEMCGNGARCLARYGVDHGLVEDAEHIRILTTAGMVFGRRIDEELYEIQLNDPSVIDLNRMADNTACAYVELGSPGIPHAVVCVEEKELNDLEQAAAIPQKSLKLIPQSNQEFRGNILRKIFIYLLQHRLQLCLYLTPVSQLL